MLTTRNQVRLILVGLASILFAAQLATYLETRDHDQDHLAASLVTYQHELSRLIDLMVRAEPENEDVDQFVQTFQANMQILRDGGSIEAVGSRQLTRPAEAEPEIVAGLESVGAVWPTFRDAALQVRDAQLAAGATEAEQARLRVELQRLLLALEALNDTYERHMARDLRVLNQTQTTLWLAALPLLGWAVWIIRSQIVRPAALLGQDGEVDQAKAMYRDEVVQLVSSFQEIRPQLEAANQSLEQVLVERTQLLATAFEYSQELVAQRRLNPLLKLTAEKAQALLDGHSAALCLVEADGSFLELRSARGQVATSIGLDRQEMGEETRLTIGPLDSDDAQGPCANCAFWQACGSDSCLSTPLQLGDQILGSLCVVRQPDRPFDHHERRALGLLGSAAAAAVSNTRLTEASRYQLRQEAVTAERERLAAQLHDSLAQTLSYLNLRVERARSLLSSGEELEVMQEFEGIQSATSQAYGQVRHVLTGLDTPQPAQVGSELQMFVEQFRQATGLRVSLVLDEPALAALPPLTAGQALHIVREAMTNAHRHAQASQVQVKVERLASELCLAVQDDGTGFQAAAVDDRSHLGLSIMRARAERCGGRFAIQPADGQGVRVEACFPLPSPEEVP